MSEEKRLEKQRPTKSAPESGSNPYKVGVPIQKQVHINTAVLSGVIGPEDFKANKPMTQDQADRLWEYSKCRYRHLPSNSVICGKQRRKRDDR